VALVDIQLPEPQEPINAQTFRFRLRKEALREVCRAEGRQTVP
jgi:hypothetical protein